MNETYPNKHEQIANPSEETQRSMGGSGIEAAAFENSDLITGVPAELKPATTDREQLQVPAARESAPASRRVALGDITEFKGNPARALGYDGIVRR